MWFLPHSYTTVIFFGYYVVFFWVLGIVILGAAWDFPSSQAGHLDYSAVNQRRYRSGHEGNGSAGIYSALYIIGKIESDGPRRNSTWHWMDSMG